MSKNSTQLTYVNKVRLCCSKLNIYVDSKSLFLISLKIIFIASSPIKNPVRALILCVYFFKQSFEYLKKQFSYNFCATYPRIFNHCFLNQK